MFLPALLPFLSLILLFLIFRQNSKDWRRAVISSVVVWSCILTAITEVLNLFSSITFSSILLSWFINGIVLLYFCHKSYFRKNSFSIRNWVMSRDKISFSRLWVNCAGIPAFTWFSIVIVALIILITGLLAIVVPPNEADSMLYHMAQVVNWMQNHNVEPYPTHVTHQADLPPLASFIKLHLQILSSGDYFANSIQWLSMIGSTISVSYIAKQLGAKPAGQVLSTIICATIPLGILQSSTTQNDYIVSFWLTCFVINVLDIFKQVSSSRKALEATALEASSSMGLGILTKPIAYLYCFPFYVLFLGCLLFKRGRKKLTLLLYAIFPAILLNVGYWWRNYKTFGEPLGITGDVTRNTLLTPSGFISILSKNLASNAVLPNQEFNNFALKLINLLHQGIGVDPSDPRTSMFSEPFRLPSAYPIMLHEAVASSPLHLALLTVSIGLYLSRKSNQSKLLTVYLTSVVFGFFLLCFLIKWHIACNRFQMPALILFSSFIGTVVSVFITHRILAYLFVIILSFSAFPAVVFSTVKPILLSRSFVLNLSESVLELPREPQYFNSFPHLKMPYKAATDVIDFYQCNNIGIYSSAKNFIFEYPIWALLKLGSSSKKEFIFQSVGVVNESARVNTDAHPSRVSPPCAILKTEDPEKKPARESLYFKNVQYKRVPSPNLISVYVDENRIGKESNTNLFLPLDSTLLFFREPEAEHRAPIKYPNSIFYQREGWSIPELEGSWTDGSTASLELFFESTPMTDIELSMAISNVFLTSNYTEKIVEVWVNGEKLETWIFRLDQSLLPEYNLKVSSELGKSQNPMLISFKVRDPKSPSDFGLSSDQRKLGFMLNQLKIRTLPSSANASESLGESIRD